MPDDAFTVAMRLMGSRELTAVQAAQLRAINRKYYQRVFDLLHSEHPAAADSPSNGDPDRVAAPRVLTDQESRALNDMLESDVRAVFAAESDPGRL